VPRSAHSPVVTTILAAMLAACGARSDLDVGDSIDEAPAARCGDGRGDPGESCDDAGRTDGGCTDDCRLDTCGNGVLEPREACDRGSLNEDRPALGVLQGDTLRALVPHPIDTTPDVYYSYTSESAHTGFEAVRTSRLFFTYGPGGLALTTLHGIDLDSSGVMQPKGVVEQTFSGVPLGAGVVVADDGPHELASAVSLSIFGRWAFQGNTDGGAIGPLPFPGTWTIQVDAVFETGIDSWQVLGDTWAYESAPIDLDAAAPAFLVAYETPSLCRRDCSVPRCGDGRLDGGEVCDDNNTSSGDGCRADCRARD